MRCPGILSLINVYTETYSDRDHHLARRSPCPRIQSTGWTASPTTPLRVTPAHIVTPRLCPRPRHCTRCQAKTNLTLGLTSLIDLKHFQSLVNHHHSSCPKHGHINLEVINSSGSANNVSNVSLPNGQAGGDQGGAPSQVSAPQPRRVSTLQQDTKEILKNYRERAICIVSMIYHLPSLHQCRQLY